MVQSQWTSSASVQPELPATSSECTTNSADVQPLCLSNELSHSDLPRNSFKHQIYCQNVNGLLTKLNQFYAEVLAADFSIYALTETALNETVNSTEVFPPEFIAYRCDRSKKTSKKTSKGGVLVAVNKRFESELLCTYEDNGCEQVWVRINNNNYHLIVASIYIPPSQSIEVYKAHMLCIHQTLEKIKHETDILIYGDFNLPKLNWQIDETTNSLIPVNISTAEECEVVNNCHENGLYQINGIPNDNNRILDLLWTNNTDHFNCNLCRNHLLSNEIHHKAITVEFDNEPFPIESKNREFYFDFANADYNCINSILNNIDWNGLLSMGSLEEKTNRFYNTINNVIKTTVQLKERKIMKHPKWFNKTAINLKNQVNALHKKSRKYQSEYVFMHYKEKRKEYTQLIRHLQYNYKIEMQQLIDDDPQQFFKHIKLTTKQSSDLPSTMTFGDNTSKSVGESTELFRAFFQSVYSEPVDKASDRFDQNQEMMNKINALCENVPRITLCENMTMSTIKKLPNNLVAGPDNIPNMFLRQCASSLVSPITQLLSESLQYGCTPSIWKKSYVHPIHKSGRKNAVENYRGVAIQCGIPKLLDSMVAKHLNYHMKNVIPFEQHGFTSGRSTVTNLSDFIGKTIKGMHASKQVDAIYLDIKKAFDTVDIELLCHKLRIMGLNREILNWIHDYLTDRKQLVKINTANISRPINVTSGVGQGYPIGATLFLLFIIDLPSHVRNALIHLFADDAKISLPINNIEDCVILQKDLNAVAEYFNLHCLELNIKKSNSITFYKNKSPVDFIYTINNLQIEKVDQIKDLGIILDRNLNFKSHIEYIVTKAKSRLAWVRRFSKEFDDPWVTKKLFMTFVLPILEYASQIWAPNYEYQIRNLESIQKQFLLFALRKFKWPNGFILPSYRHRLLLLDMNSLNDRRKIARICFVHSLLTNSISSPPLLSELKLKIPGRITRHSANNLLYTNDLKDPINIMCKNYNEFSTVIDFNQNTDIVKKNLKTYFKRIV